MKTLVIHPHDKTTHFLRPIYEDISNKTVVTGGMSTNSIKHLIIDHDRVIMLGHGSPSGLFGVGFDSSFVIDSNLVPYLKEKKDNNIYIWCNADKFVTKHNLEGFYSGMFISEVSEAAMYGYYCGQSIVDESNNAFAQLLGLHANKWIDKLYEGIKKDYGWVADMNEIAKFNNERLYFKEQKQCSIV